MRIKDYILKTILYCFRVFPIKKNKVLFISYFGNYYNDNPMMISKELEKNPDVDVVWGFEKGVSGPDTVRGVNVSSFRFLYELATARVWVDNARKRIWMTKRKGQYYIQTWHGCLGIKKFEGAAEDRLEPDYVLRAKHDSKQMNLLISGCSWFTDYCKKYFWYDGEILECGTPRLDVFFGDSDKIKAKVREKLQIDSDKYVVLYAPTFRADYRMDCYNLDFSRLADAINKQCGKEAVFLTRMHPNLAGKEDLLDWKADSRIINATPYPDIYELITASDLIISDYSSVALDAGIINKKVFLYTPDLAEYTAERGFNWSISEFPFPCAEDNDGFINQFNTFDQSDYQSKMTRFYDSLGIKERGKASEIIADRICKVIKE